MNRQLGNREDELGVEREEKGVLERRLEESRRTENAMRV